MEKISLRHLNLHEVELLTREHLKNVLGGFTNSTDPGTTDNNGGNQGRCIVDPSIHGSQSPCALENGVVYGVCEPAPWNPNAYICVNHQCSAYVYVDQC